MRYRVNRVHVGVLAVRLTVQMYGNNRLRLWTNRCLQFASVHSVGHWIYVNEYRPCSRCIDRLSGRYECMRDSNDFITRSNAQSLQYQLQRGSAVGYRDAMCCTAVGGKCLFELVNLRSQNEAAIRKDAVKSFF